MQESDLDASPDPRFLFFCFPFYFSLPPRGVKHTWPCFVVEEGALECHTSHAESQGKL